MSDITNRIESVREIVERLKDQRRAEAAVAEADRIARDEHMAREREEEMERTIMNVIRSADAEWLIPLRCGEIEDMGQWESSQAIRAARFRVPGHRDFFIVVGQHNYGWAPAGIATHSEISTWQAIDGDGMTVFVEDLPAALLAVELPPIAAEPGVFERVNHRHDCD